MNIALFGIIGR